MPKGNFLSVNGDVGVAGNGGSHLGTFGEERILM